MDKKDTLEVNLKEIKDNITVSIHHLREIIKSVKNEDSIDSYESSYCTDCDNECGRSNAEIYNCMIEKLSQAQQVQEQYDNMQYTKDFLISDLEKIEKTLIDCDKKVTSFIH